MTSDEVKEYDEKFDTPITFEDIMKQLDELSEAADRYVESTKRVQKLYEDFKNNK